MTVSIEDRDEFDYVGHIHQAIDTAQALLDHIVENFNPAPEGARLDYQRIPTGERRSDGSPIYRENRYVRLRAEAPVLDGKKLRSYGVEGGEGEDEALRRIEVRDAAVKPLQEVISALLDIVEKDNAAVAALINTEVID